MQKRPGSWRTAKNAPEKAHLGEKKYEVPSSLCSPEPLGCEGTDWEHGPLEVVLTLDTRMRV